ncbi:hypothetical protein L9F63_013867, partial [Diploptera punctata]
TEAGLLSSTLKCLIQLALEFNCSLREMFSPSIIGSSQASPITLYFVCVITIC